jgi:hypothetical protein
MPRRRKGTENYTPSIDVLLRDAMPTYREIAGEPDLRKRREKERARDFAIDCLAKMYRDAQKRRPRGRPRKVPEVAERKQTGQLDPRVRIFCEQLKDHNHGRLPRPKGGRPTAEHRRLLIAVRLHEAIEARGRKRGAVKEALSEVAECYGLSYDHVWDIYRDRDPEWLDTVAVELARREIDPPKSRDRP